MCFSLILRLDAFYRSFQRWPRCISSEEERDQKQNNSWQRIGAGTTKCICYLMIDLEIKCLKQQYILAHLILHFAENRVATDLENLENLEKSGNLKETAES